LQLLESPQIDTHGPFTAVADANGNIFGNSFITDSHDIGVLFYLTATGSVSRAQTTFMDSGNFSYFPASQSLTLSPLGGGYFTQNVTDPKNNDALTASPVETGTGPTATRLPASWVTTSPATLSFPASSSDQTKSWVVTVTVPSGTTPATYTGTINAHATGCTQCPNDGNSNSFTNLSVTGHDRPPDWFGDRGFPDRRPDLWDW